MDYTDSNHGNITTLEKKNAVTFLGLLNSFFGAYLMLAVIFLGFVGNTLSIIVFVRQRWRNNAASVYLVSLALSDSGNLIMSFQTWLHNGLFYITNGEINIPSGASDLGCQLRIFVWNSFVFMSGYIIIAYSVERCYAVLRPLNVAAVFTSGRRKTVLITCLFISFVSYAPAFWVYETNVYELQGITRRYCHQTKKYVAAWVMKSFGVWMFNSNSTLPVCLVLIINTTIVVGVVQAGKVKHIGKDSKSDITQRKLVKNLLLVSSVYFLSMSPYVILNVIFDITGTLLLSGEWLTAISNVIVFNYAVNLSFMFAPCSTLGTVSGLYFASVNNVINDEKMRESYLEMVSNSCTS